MSSVEHEYVVEVNWKSDRLGVLYSPELTDKVEWQHHHNLIRA